MDSGLNRSAGIIVRNFYLTVINPTASESRQINLGRAITAVFGVLMIAMGLYFNTLQALPLFDLILLAAAAVGIPTSVPLFLGMFIKRVPAWAAWSTAAVGFAASILLRIPLGTEGFIQSVFPGQPALTPQEIADLNIAITTGVLITVCGMWFLATMFFYKRSPAAYQAQVESFFSEMNTPIDMRTEHVPSYDNDRRQYIVIGQACFFYGLFILLLALFPNTLTGRLGFAFCGVSIGGVGAICWWLGRKLKLPPWEKAENDA
jgi:SSS family solute:Na+ symporter